MSPSTMLPGLRSGRSSLNFCAFENTGLAYERPAAMGGSLLFVLDVSAERRRKQTRDRVTRSRPDKEFSFS